MPAPAGLGGLHRCQRGGPAGEAPDAVAHQLGGGGAEGRNGVLHRLLVLLRGSRQGRRKGAEGQRGQHRVGLRWLPADLRGADQQQPPAAPRGVYRHRKFQLGKGSRIRQFDAGARAGPGVRRRPSDGTGPGRHPGTPTRRACRRRRTVQPRLRSVTHGAASPPARGLALAGMTDSRIRAMVLRVTGSGPSIRAINSLS